MIQGAPQNASVARAEKAGSMSGGLLDDVKYWGFYPENNGKL